MAACVYRGTHDHNIITAAGSQSSAWRGPAIVVAVAARPYGRRTGPEIINVSYIIKWHTRPYTNPDAARWNLYGISVAFYRRGARALPSTRLFSDTPTSLRYVQLQLTSRRLVLTITRITTFKKKKKKREFVIYSYRFIVNYNNGQKYTQNV